MTQMYSLGDGRQFLPMTFKPPHHYLSCLRMSVEEFRDSSVRVFFVSLFVFV